jgi:hypothetical protein
LFHTEPSLVNKKDKLKREFFQQFKKEKRCIKVIKELEAKQKKQAPVVAV